MSDDKLGTCRFCYRPLKYDSKLNSWSHILNSDYLACPTSHNAEPLPAQPAAQVQTDFCDVCRMLIFRGFGGWFHVETGKPVMGCKAQPAAPTAPVLNDKAPEMPKPSEPFVSGMGQGRSQVRAFGAPEPMTWAEYRKGCLETYGGGYRSNDELLKAFHHGIETVFNLLEAEFIPTRKSKSADPAPNVTTAPEEAAARRLMDTIPYTSTTLNENASYAGMEPETQSAEREAFEKWVATGKNFKPQILARDGKGAYYNARVEDCWEGWQACSSAREAQIAELLARLDAIAALATTDGGPVPPLPQDKVQK